MITNNSKNELKQKIQELEERLIALNDKKAKLLSEVDFINTRKQKVKEMIDDLKADSV